MGAARGEAEDEEGAGDNVPPEPPLCPRLSVLRGGREGGHKERLLLGPPPQKILTARAWRPLLRVGFGMGAASPPPPRGTKATPLLLHRANSGGETVVAFKREGSHSLGWGAVRSPSPLVSAPCMDPRRRDPTSTFPPHDRLSLPMTPHPPPKDTHDPLFLPQDPRDPPSPPVTPPSLPMTSRDPPIAPRPPIPPMTLHPPPKNPHDPPFPPRDPPSLPMTSHDPPIPPKTPPDPPRDPPSLPITSHSSP